VGPGDILLLGDLASPVRIRIDEAPPAMSPEYDGGTVVARRSVTEAQRVLDADIDAPGLRQLFRLLSELSGRVDPGAVMARIAVVVLERFPHARAVTILLRDDKGQYVPEFTRAREGEGAALRPSGRLVQRAIDRREVVAYVPGDHEVGASVAGLAGTAVVPLLAADEVIGILHVDSTRKAFGGDDAAWLTIVGTHVAASLVCARRFRSLARSEADLRAENAALRGAASMPRPLLGRSEALKSVLKQMERVARTQTTVLLLGETGTGKELAARYVHAHSPRADQRFAALNCAALPENLLESELFGYRKGAFTGATRDYDGLFVSANAGTVFLDEIGEISPAVQVRLLRVLQEREVQPVGAARPVPVDVRIVAATNRDLRAEVEAGRFREDLYYRLAVFPVRLPPLRERDGDVELLAERFREAACARNDKWVPGFTSEAIDALRRAPWPGNVRELEHEVERAVILADDGEPIGLDLLSPRLVGRDANAGGEEEELPVGELRDVMEQLEERVIRRALESHGGNRTRTAETLGISRQALQAKLARWRDRGL
jgi:transcriptional regulator with GAF, ATPase, and Fis domain